LPSPPTAATWSFSTSSDRSSTGHYSPDGNPVVFATDEGATFNPKGNTFADIVTMRLGAGKLTYVTHAANLDGWPTWGTAP
jgi:hypothetical protein